MTSSVSVNSPVQISHAPQAIHASFGVIEWKFGKAPSAFPNSSHVASVIAGSA